MLLNPAPIARVSLSFPTSLLATRTPCPDWEDPTFPRGSLTEFILGGGEAGASFAPTGPFLL